MTSTRNRPQNIWHDGQKRWDSTSLGLTTKPEQVPCATSPNWATESDLPSTTSIDRVFERLPQPPGPMTWALKVETGNSSNWEPAKLCLSMNETSGLLPEEHHLPRCRETKQWCQRKGWTSLFSPALPGDIDDSRSCTAGDALLVRDFLGLSRWTAGLQEPCIESDDEGIVAGRVMSGVVTLLYGSAISVASGCWCASQGLRECTWNLVATVCRLAMRPRLEMVVG